MEILSVKLVGEFCALLREKPVIKLNSQVEIFKVYYILQVK